MKKYTRLFAALLLTALFLSACAQAGPVPKLENYQTYEDAAHAYRIQYPDTLTLFAKSQSKEMLDAAIATFNIPADLLASLDTGMISAMWYKKSEADADFITNLNVTSSDASGLTQTLLKQKAGQQQLEAVMMEQYEQMLPGVALAAETSGKEFNKTYFVHFQIKYDMDGSIVYLNQFITSVNKRLYTLSLSSTEPDMLTALPEIETILSTFEAIG